VLRTPWKPYGLAVLVTLAAVALTRVTWPLFSVAPFAPVFAAVAVATHWGSGWTGLLAIALSVAGLGAAFPSSGPFPWNPVSLPVFAAIALVGSRLIDGRNKATAALRASEAELRATLESVRASEENVRRAQKMEAVGQLAAGVAHNFNNLLQVTMGYTDVLLDEHEDAAVRAAATEIRRATERGAALTRQLLAFGRKHDARVTRVEMAAMMTSLREMLARVIREDIQLTMDLEDGHAVLIDPSDLEQVIFNLVINARDALPSGGTIHVSLDSASIDAGNGAGEQAVGPRTYVRLRVRDNGVGMTADVQAHLFEPVLHDQGRRRGHRTRPRVRRRCRTSRRRLRHRRERARAGDHGVAVPAAMRGSRRRGRARRASGAGGSRRTGDHPARGGRSAGQEDDRAHARAGGVLSAGGLFAVRGVHDLRGRGRPHQPAADRHRDARDARSGARGAPGRATPRSARAVRVRLQRRDARSSGRRCGNPRQAVYDIRAARRRPGDTGRALTTMTHGGNEEC
jgi:signal transduction histidine kinase